MKKTGVIRCEIIFKGRVQGVGFRYTARDFADEAGIVGWVKNLPDGSVQMVAEGAEPAIEDFLKRLESYFSVSDKTIIYSEARGDFGGFEITY